MQLILDKYMAQLIVLVWLYFVFLVLFSRLFLLQIKAEKWGKEKVKEKLSFTFKVRLGGMGKKKGFLFPLFFCFCEGETIAKELWLKMHVPSELTCQPLQSCLVTDQTKQGKKFCFFFPSNFEHNFITSINLSFLIIFPVHHIVTKNSLKV